MIAAASWRRRTWLPILLLAASTAACASDQTNDYADASPDARKGDGGAKDRVNLDVAPGGATCAWAPAGAPELPSDGTVKGSLQGDSRNRSTTCTRQQGTGGPDGVYVLRVRERSIVTLAVKSSFDSVLAVRKACDDPLTEVACADGQLAPGPQAEPVPQPSPFPSPVPGRVDAAAPPMMTGTNPADASLRTTLDAGTYFVIVDEAAAFGVGGAFELVVETEAPPANVSCAMAEPLTTGLVVEKDLDIATTAPTGCGGLPQRPALFYQIVLAPGEQLTARATALSGSTTWQPQLALLDGCMDSLCLATDDASRISNERILRHTNAGPTPKTVVLAVASDVGVVGARFHLETRVALPTTNLSCASATPVTDGTMLRDVDPSDAQIGSPAPCGTFGRFLYYSIELVPGQSATVTARSQNLNFPVLIAAGPTCTSCTNATQGQLSLRNDGADTQRFLVAVSPTDPAAKAFSVDVSAPLPPGSVLVSPTAGHVVDEKGATSAFAVRLGSPPLQPVTIRVESSDLKEVTVSPPALTFTSNDWNTPQGVTIVGVDDSVSDGDRSVSVRVLPSESADARYAGIGGTTVSVVNQDDEPGVRVTPRTIATSESGGATELTVRLIRQPAATVRLPVSSSVPTEAKLSASELVFTTTDWSDAHKVTVTGQDDTARDGTQPFDVVLGPLVSDDPAYAGIDPADLPGANADDEFVAVAHATISPLGRRCRTPNTLGLQTVAADAVGTIYVAMSCEELDKLPPGGPVDAAGSPQPRDAGVASGGVWMAASHDGGSTFDLVPIAGVPFAFDFTVAPGRGSTAYAAFSNNDGIVFARTDDAGRTWQTTLLKTTSFVNLMRMASDGDAVWLAAGVGNRGSLWRSEHANSEPLVEAAFAAPLGGVWSLFYDRPTDHLLVIGGDSSTVMLSRDRGASFEKLGAVIPSSLFGTSWAQSPGAIHAIGFDQVHVTVAADQPSNVSSVPLPALEHASMRNIVADEAGVLTVFQSPFMTGLDAVRVSPDGKVSDRRSLATGFVGSPSGVALSRRAVAVSYWRDGEVRFGIETFP